MKQNVNTRTSVAVLTKHNILFTAIKKTLSRKQNCLRRVRVRSLVKNYKSIIKIIKTVFGQLDDYACAFSTKCPIPTRSLEPLTLAVFYNLKASCVCDF